MRTVSWLIALVFFTASLCVDASDNIQSDIQEIFPKATVIGPKDSNFPVWPVYQLSELLGYAFESNDLVDLPGFAGKPVNLLIGIDSSGYFQGFKVVQHNEPIFHHGLGPKPMLAFIDQYPGRRVSDRIIVGGAPKNNQGSETPGTAYFDGVTKATVSVIVINDTILASSLQVARNKLSEFAQSAPAKAREDIFEPMSLADLVANNYVKRWQLPLIQIEEALGRSIEDYPPQLFEEGPTETGIQIQYAYLNTPTIGRNLLGEQEFERLKSVLRPNEHAVAIMSEGFYPYLEENFRPGTVPDRISLQQNGLPITIRDLNFYNYEDGGQKSVNTIADNLQIFRINSQSGFDPSAPMSLVLNMRLARNHLITDEASFVDEYQLPPEFFEVTEQSVDIYATQKPTWVRIWENRTAEIVILCISLVILTVAFLKQHAFSKHVRAFHRFRWAYLFFTLFFIGFYAQGQLSVINIYTLLLEIWNGFSLQVFLLDPILFILWSYTALSLILWGRGLFCGWLCPFGALQEMVSWVAKKLRIKQINVKPKAHQFLILVKYVILLAIVGTAFFSITVAERLSEIEPFKTSITLFFIRYWPFVLYAVLLLAAGLFIHKFYCRYLCPLGAGLAVIGKLRRFEWLSRRKECGTPCQLCRNRCEINAIHRDGTIDYDECIQCLECIVILNDQQQCAPSMVASKKAGKSTGGVEEVVPLPIINAPQSG